MIFRTFLESCWCSIIVYRCPFLRYRYWMFTLVLIWNAASLEKIGFSMKPPSSIFKSTFLQNSHLFILPDAVSACSYCILYGLRYNILCDTFRTVIFCSIPCSPLTYSNSAETPHAHFPCSQQTS